MKWTGENEQDLCMPSLFSVLIRDTVHILWSGKLLLPNVVSSQIKQIKDDVELKLFFIELWLVLVLQKI